MLSQMEGEVATQEQRCAGTDPSRTVNQSSIVYLMTSCMILETFSPQTCQFSLV